MISTFSTVSEPSQSVISLAVAGLLIIMIWTWFIDRDNASSGSMVKILRSFSSPLLVLFVLVVVMRILKIIPT